MPVLATCDDILLRGLESNQQAEPIPCRDSKTVTGIKLWQQFELAAVTRRL